MAGRRTEQSVAAIAERQAATMPVIIRRLLEGEGLGTICRDKGMPDRSTVRRWCADDPALADQVRIAREDGFTDRAERAVENAKNAKDPLLGRLAFDAERWYLGKLSNAFAERPPRIESQTNVQVNIDGDATLGRLVEFMDGAAARLSSGAGSTSLVVADRTPGSDSSAG